MAKRDPNGTGRGQPKPRCAIYTRKSSEEGLEQDFNSLDAQREACVAYIASQKHEGWKALTEIYDDGGFSGGTMDRPALKRLLADVAAGHIDVVVVYKVDRLTRALSDFAKMVETFDERKVSFVSVTQAFNTTTSMGRLTLNVLLSFAQFEREVTGERIRDKIAASKKKGMWMGGQPSLGYDVRNRKLVVNEAEAGTVRHVFQRYRDLRSVRLLAVELEAEGILSKARRAANGSEAIEITLDTSGLIRWLSGGSEPSGIGEGTEPSLPILTVPVRLKRTGLEMRLLVQGGTEQAAPDGSLTRIMVRAHAIRDRLFQDENLTVEEVAREADLVPSYVTRLLRLTFLAPDIVTSIIAGRQPAELTARKLMADTRLPLEWSEQRIQLGFA